MPPIPRPAVFLDRDDTLIRTTGLAPDGDLGDPGLVELLPGAQEACVLLSGAGLFLGVITNQGGVARGKYTTHDVERVHARLNELLGGLIDEFRYCPFHPKGTVPEFTREHAWRKPQPGMILDMAERRGLDLASSWVIGDAPRDCIAGRGAGCSSVLIAREDPETCADAIVPNILDAARLVLQRTGATR